MSNRDIKKENEIISNLTGYLANTAIYDSERNRIIEWLNYGGHNRFIGIFDERDERKPFVEIAAYYEHLYECNGMNSNHRECVAFREKVKKALIHLF